MGSTQLRLCFFLLVIGIECYVAPYDVATTGIAAGKYALVKVVNIGYDIYSHLHSNIKLPYAAVILLGYRKY